jgi:hypothetical protein
VILLDTPGLAWQGGRILSETIGPMATNGAKGHTGERRALQALAAELDGRLTPSTTN